MNELRPWSALLLKWLAATLAFGMPRGSLLVLVYHRVLPEADPLLPDEPDVASFTAEIDAVCATCSVLPLGEAVDRLYSGSLPANAACITFDDGYANSLTCAAPILQARGVPATFFIASDILHSGRMWNDTVLESVRRAGEEVDFSRIGLGRIELPDSDSRRRAAQALINAIKYWPPETRLRTALEIADAIGCELPSNLMLSEGQVKELVQRGMEVGAHTVSHPILTRVDEDVARREISESKATLEDVTGTAVRLFAYPNGIPCRDYDRRHVEMVRAAGFTAAVSTAWGACHLGSDRFQLPRLRPWETSAVRFAGRLLYARRCLQERGA